MFLKECSLELHTYAEVLKDNSSFCIGGKHLRSNSTKNCPQINALGPHNGCSGTSTLLSLTGPFSRTRLKTVELSLISFFCYSPHNQPTKSYSFFLDYLSLLSHFQHHHTCLYAHYTPELSDRSHENVLLLPNMLPTTTGFI